MLKENFIIRRRRLRLSQKELGKLLNRYPMTIAQYESGRYPIGKHIERALCEIERRDNIKRFGKINIFEYPFPLPESKPFTVF